jgi:hypothetical protein
VVRKASTDGCDLIDGLALAEDDFGLTLPDCPVVIEVGEPHVLARQMLDAIIGPLDGYPASGNVIQK